MAENPHAEEITFLNLDDESGSPREQNLESAFSEECVHDGLRRAGVQMPIGFHGPESKGPQRVKEAPYHRTVAYLLAQGHSQKFIAQFTGRRRETICSLANEPHIKELIAYFLQEAGGDPLRTLFQGAAEDGFYKLQELMNDSKVPANVKANIAQSFIDRKYGKASSTIVHEHKEAVADPKAQADNLMAELEKLDKLKREALERQNQTQPRTESNGTTEPTNGPDFSKVD